jgi:hypothetical protein
MKVLGIEQSSLTGDLLQFFDGKEADRPHYSKAHPYAAQVLKPDLHLELEQVGVTGKLLVRLRIVVANRGAKGIYFDPSFMGGELVRVSFTDEETHKRVHFKDDEMMGYTPLTPEHNIQLWPGMFVGYEQDFLLASNPPRLTAKAVCTYFILGKKKVDDLWVGTLDSAKLPIK